jgi:DNA-binding IclR family transcriptional regulator
MVEGEEMEEEMEEMDHEGEGMEDEEWLANVRGYAVSFHFHSGLL